MFTWFEIICYLIPWREQAKKIDDRIGIWFKEIYPKGTRHEKFAEVGLYDAMCEIFRSERGSQNLNKNIQVYAWVKNIIGDWKNKK